MAGRLWGRGPVAVAHDSALQRVESSQIRDGTSVFCTARQTLNHQATHTYIKYNIYFKVCWVILTHLPLVNLCWLSQTDEKV